MNTRNLGDSTPQDYPYISRLVLYLFCGYVIAWYLQIGERWPLLGSLRFEFIYAALLSVFVFIYSKSIQLKCPILPYLFFYLVVLIIQIPLSEDINTSTNIFIDRIIKFSFLGIFIVTFVRSPTDLKYFLGAFFLACMKMGQEGVYGKITGGSMWENQGVMRLHGVTSLYQHPNSYAGMALGTVPFIFRLWPISGRFIKIAFAILMLFATNIILFSGSRTAYVGVFGLMFFFWITSKAKKRLFLIGLIAFMAGLAVMPGQYFDRLQSIYTLQEKEGASATTRIQILEDAVEVFIQNPFGIGIGAFPAVRQKIFGRMQDTHNLYLEIATNLGIQGLIIFALLLFKTLKLLHSINRDASEQIELLRKGMLKENDTGELAKRAKDHANDLALISATASSVFLFIMMRLILGLFGMDLYEIYWWFAFGLTIALFNMNMISTAKTNSILGLNPTTN